MFFEQSEKIVIFVQKTKSVNSYVIQLIQDKRNWKSPKTEG